MYIFFPFALFICFAFEEIQKYFKDFVGISSANPHETSIIHLGELKGLKGWLHMSNAAVIPTKVSILLEDKQKIGVSVFDL